jgi:hypothetical protein
MRQLKEAIKMPLQHVVKRGDSLWGLAGRHLGNFARWPELLEYHNGEVRKLGGNRGRTFAIKDPNIIFVGQILYLPIRGKHMMRTVNSTGAKAQAGKTAIPINLQIEYSFGDNRPPIVYLQDTANYSIKAEMKGRITLEIITLHQVQKNIDIVTSRNQMEYKQKLRETYNPAIIQLITKPEMKLSNGVLELVSAMTENASGGPCKVNVSASDQNHYMGNLKQPPITGHLEINGLRFKYVAEVEYKVDIKEIMAGGGGAIKANNSCSCEIGCAVKLMGRIFTEAHFTSSFDAITAWVGYKVPMSLTVNVASTVALTSISGVRTYAGAEKLGQKMNQYQAECLETCK